MVKLARCVSPKALREVAADIATSLKLLLTSDLPFVPRYAAVESVKNVLTAVISACERGLLTAPSFALVFPIVEHILVQPVQSAFYEDMVRILSIHASALRLTPSRIIQIHGSIHVPVLYRSLRCGSLEENVLQGVSQKMLDMLLLRHSQTVVIGKRGIDGQCLAVDRLVSGELRPDQRKELDKKMCVVDTTIALGCSGNALIAYFVIANASTIWEESTKTTDMESINEYASNLLELAVQNTRRVCLDTNSFRIIGTVNTMVIMILEGFYRYSVTVPKDPREWNDAVDLVFPDYLYEYTYAGCGAEAASECLAIGESVSTDPDSMSLGRYTGELPAVELIKEVARSVYHASDGELVGEGIDMCYMGRISDEEIKTGRCAVARWANGYKWSFTVMGADGIRRWCQDDDVSEDEQWNYDVHGDGEDSSDSYEGSDDSYEGSDEGGDEGETEVLVGPPRKRSRRE